MKRTREKNNGKNHFLAEEKEENEKEKMWKMLLDVSILSGVPGGRRFISITNIRRITEGGRYYERRQRTLPGMWRKRWLAL